MADRDRPWEYKCSFQACSLLSPRGGLRLSSTARVERGPSNSLPSLKRSGQGCPLLRASDEHILIVRVLRARRAPGRSLLIPLRSHVAEKRRLTGHAPTIFSGFLFPFRAFSIDRKINRPSSLPRTSSVQRSGCGIMPSTLPSALMIPAILSSEPFGFA